MPTRIPRRRNFLRRHTPDAETQQNLLATFGEFGLALVFVAVTVLVIALVERGGLSYTPPPPTIAPFYAP